ncbi:MAG: PIN domain-containing protein [Zoogloeaceae bacterium]|jgi:predicted nucleic acid-binding protein|nr:PIN domain-containing protein [Zoogloeaceae bacterium]
MYLLDAPVLFELRKSAEAASPEVRRWAANVPFDQIFVSVLTLVDMERQALAEASGDAGIRLWLADLRQSFALRAVPFTLDAVDRAAAFAQAGLSLPDAALAAQADLRQLMLITPDPGRFAASGIKCLDPWTA